MLKASDVQVAKHRVAELASLIWHHKDANAADIRVNVRRVIEYLDSLSLADGAEAMLARQMVGVHFTPLESLRRAAIPERTDYERGAALKHAHKQITLYVRQLDTLNKRRSKGQQKVTGEHVHADKGGQAIVGNVETSDRGNAETAPPELEQKPEDTVSLEYHKKAKLRQKKRK